MPRADSDLGQHLLVDERAIGRIMTAAALQPGEHVLDAGAGAGALTRPIAAAVGPRGRVHAIELDERLRESLRADTPAHVDVIAGDLLHVPWPDRLDAVVANPPFKIAAPLVERIAALGVPRAVLVLPRELVERLVAEPGTARYGKLTVRVALQAQVEDLGTLSRHAFAPPPEVACGFLGMQKRSDVAPADPATLERVLDAAQQNWKQPAKRTFDLLARQYRVDSAELTRLLRAEGWADLPVAALPPGAFAMVARFLHAHGRQ